jgi:hypothetical protein
VCGSALEQEREDEEGREEERGISLDWLPVAKSVNEREEEREREKRKKQDREKAKEEETSDLFGANLR